MSDSKLPTIPATRQADANPRRTGGFLESWGGYSDFPAIHPGRPLPGWQRWCTLRRWIRTRVPIHLTGRAISVSVKAGGHDAGLLLFHRARKA